MIKGENHSLRIERLPGDKERRGQINFPKEDLGVSSDKKESPKDWRWRWQPKRSGAISKKKIIPKKQSEKKVKVDNFPDLVLEKIFL